MFMPQSFLKTLIPMSNDCSLFKYLRLPRQRRFSGQPLQKMCQLWITFDIKAFLLPFQINAYFVEKEMEKVDCLFLLWRIVTLAWSHFLCLHGIQWCFSSLLEEEISIWGAEDLGREGKSCGNYHLQLSSGSCGRRQMRIFNYKNFSSLEALINLSKVRMGLCFNCRKNVMHA